MYVRTHLLSCVVLVVVVVIIVCVVVCCTCVCLNLCVLLFWNFRQYVCSSVSQLPLNQSL